MMVPGTIYGVVLNDGLERDRLVTEFGEKPYAAVPQAPVIYIKPNLTVGGSGSVKVPSGVDSVVVSATIGLLFAADASRVAANRALDHVGAMCLAIDISLPQPNYYRPAIREKTRDGFLPLGAPTLLSLPASIDTEVDGQQAHSFELSRLVRSPAQLISDLSMFMTLRAGDMLLVGLASDAPRSGAGSMVTVRAAGLPELSTLLVGDRR